jgi:hypothetical protein
LIGFVYLRQKKIGVYRTCAVRSFVCPFGLKPIFTITMLDYFPHMSQCLSSGEDRIWSPLNKNTMHLFSGSLSFSLVASFKFGNHKSFSLILLRFVSFLFRFALYMCPAACYWNEQSNDLNYNFRNATKKSGICIKPSVLYNKKNINFVADPCFSLCTPFSSTNKTDPHDITEICWKWC